MIALQWPVVMTAGLTAEICRFIGRSRDHSRTRYNRRMFYVEIFLLLIFTVLCGILLALWRIREILERNVPGATLGGAASSAAATSARPPAA
jgi:hypothetical protein